MRKIIATLLREQSQRPPLREQYLNERATGGAVKPFPWRGKGFGKRLKPSLGQGGLGSCEESQFSWICNPAASIVMICNPKKGFEKRKDRNSRNYHNFLISIVQTHG